MATNIEKKSLRDAIAGEIFYDKNTNQVSYKNELGQTVPLSTGGVVKTVTGLDTDNTDPANPVINISTDGVTLTGDGTPGNPLQAAGGAVNYANVFFVDSTNGNDSTALINDFSKPFTNASVAITTAYYTSPTSTNKALVYVRKGTYTNQFMAFYDNVDVYCEPGVVFTGSSSLWDYGASADSKFLGYAKFVNTAAVKICKTTGPTSKIHFECDEIIAYGGAFEVQSGANLYFKARKVDADGYTFLETGYLRGTGNIVIDISEEYKSFGQHFKFVFFAGKAVINCPRLFLKDGGPHSANQKQVIMCDANAGGEAIVNGNMYADPARTTYYGGISAMITRWNDSWMTLRFNGGIFAENQLGINAQGASGANRTIINGDVRTNMQVAYIANNSRVVFRNGTLMNWNTEATSISSFSPILNINQSAVVFVENCHLHNLGTGGFDALWKMSTASSLSVYNSVYSGQDAIGLFIKNSVAGTPTNNVRLLNTRATKALDTNITDLLSPTGFVQDANILSINFI